MLERFGKWLKGVEPEKATAAEPQEAPVEEPKEEMIPIEEVQDPSALKKEVTEELAKMAEASGEAPDDIIRELREAERVWFRRLLSHNIRMPMTIIAGYGDLLKNHGLKTREEEVECISKICKNIEYLDTLFKVLVDDEKNMELLREKEWFDLLECGREAFDYVKSMTRKANITISVNSSREHVLFYGNRIVMMRAFYNLVENSIRYMKRAGNICLTVEETDEQYLVVYRDNGEGMDANEAETITQLNSQGSNARQDGHGIGMYLVRQAVENHGGTLSIRTGQGEGMAVYMIFPRQNIAGK